MRQPLSGTWPRTPEFNMAYHKWFISFLVVGIILVDLSRTECPLGDDWAIGEDVWEGWYYCYKPFSDSQVDFATAVSTCSALSTANCSAQLLQFAHLSEVDLPGALTSDGYWVDATHDGTDWLNSAGDAITEIVDDYTNFVDDFPTVPSISTTEALQMNGAGNLVGVAKANSHYYLCSSCFVEPVTEPPDVVCPGFCSVCQPQTRSIKIDDVLRAKLSHNEILELTGFNVLSSDANFGMVEKSSSRRHLRSKALLQAERGLQRNGQGCKLRRSAYQKVLNRAIIDEDDSMNESRDTPLGTNYYQNMLTDSIYNRARTPDLDSLANLAHMTNVLIKYEIENPTIVEVINQRKRSRRTDALMAFNIGKNIMPYIGRDTHVRNGHMLPSGDYYEDYPHYYDDDIEDEDGNSAVRAGLVNAESSMLNVLLNYNKDSGVENRADDNDKARNLPERSPTESEKVSNFHDEEERGMMSGAAAVLEAIQAYNKEFSGSNSEEAQDDDAEEDWDEDAARSGQAIALEAIQAYQNEISGSGYPDFPISGRSVDQDIEDLASARGRVLDQKIKVIHPSYDGRLGPLEEGNKRQQRTEHIYDYKPEEDLPDGAKRNERTHAFSHHAAEKTLDDGEERNERTESFMHFKDTNIVVSHPEGHSSMERTDAILGMERTNQEIKSGHLDFERTHSLLDILSEHHKQGSSRERIERTESIFGMDEPYPKRSRLRDRFERTEAIFDLEDEHHLLGHGRERFDRTDAIYNIDLENHIQGHAREKAERTDAIYNMDVENHVRGHAHEKSDRTEAIFNMDTENHIMGQAREKTRRTEAIYDMDPENHSRGHGRDKAERTDAIFDLGEAHHSRGSAHEKMERTGSIINLDMGLRSSGHMREKMERTDAILNLQEPLHEKGHEREKMERTDAILNLQKGHMSSGHERIKMERTEAIFTFEEGNIGKQAGLHRMERTSSILDLIRQPDRPGDGREKMERTDAIINLQDGGQHSRGAGREHAERTDAILNLEEPYHKKKQLAERTDSILEYGDLDDDFYRREMANAERTDSILDYNEHGRSGNEHGREKQERTDAIMLLKDMAPRHDKRDRFDRTSAIMLFLNANKWKIVGEEWDEDEKLDAVTMGRTLMDEFSQRRAAHPVERLFDSFAGLVQEEGLHRSQQQSWQSEMLLQFVKAVPVSPHEEDRAPVLTYLEEFKSNVEMIAQDLPTKVSAAFGSDQDLVNIEHVEELTSSMFEVIKYSVLSRLIAVTDAQAINQQHVLTRIDSLLDYLKSDIILGYFDDQLNSACYNRLLQKRTDSVLNLIKDEAILQFTAEQHLTRREANQLENQANALFDFIKEEMLQARMSPEAPAPERLNEQHEILQKGINFFHENGKSFLELARVENGSQLTMDEKRAKAKLSEKILRAQEL